MRSMLWRLSRFFLNFPPPPARPPPVALDAVAGAAVAVAARDRYHPTPGPMQTHRAIEEGGVALSFSATLEYVRAVRHFLEALCTASHYTEEESQAIALVTTEILNNSIEHGARGPADEIHLALCVRPDYFRCEVRDPGRGGREFAATALDRAGHVPALDEARGRGLFLIRKNMDNLEVSFDPKTGTKVVVYKARKP